MLFKQVLLFLIALACAPQMVFSEAPPSEDFFESFDGTKIYFSDEGEGAALILIHGFVVYASSWDQTVLKVQLLEEGYRVIVPDLRGNGKSQRPQDPEAYSDDAEIKDLQALADYLGLDQYLAVGYSRGSIVLAMLLTEDERVTKAVFGGMGFDFINPDWDRRIAFADAFGGRSELTDLTRGAVNYAESIGADLKVLGYLQDYQPVTSADELGQIEIDCLVICGDQDRDNGDPKELSDHLPNSKVDIVEGVHNNTYKQVFFAEEVIEFLAQK